MNRIVRKEEICNPKRRYQYWLFGTVWNSKVSFLWWRAHPTFDYQLREGYVDFNLGYLKIRFRKHGRKRAWLRRLLRSPK